MWEGEGKGEGEEQCLVWNVRVYVNMKLMHVVPDVAAPFAEALVQSIEKGEDGGGVLQWRSMALIDDRL
jgi:peroxiredoxin